MKRINLLALALLAGFVFSCQEQQELIEPTNVVDTSENAQLSFLLQSAGPVSTGTIKVGHLDKQARITTSNVSRFADKLFTASEGKKVVAGPLQFTAPGYTVEIGGGEGYGVTSAQDGNTSKKKQINGDEKLQVSLRRTNDLITKIDLTFRNLTPGEIAIVEGLASGCKKGEKVNIEVPSDFTGTNYSTTIEFENPVKRLVFSAGAGSAYQFRASTTIHVANFERTVAKGIGPIDLDESKHAQLIKNLKKRNVSDADGGKAGFQILVDVVDHVDEGRCGQGSRIEFRESATGFGIGRTNGIGNNGTLDAAFILKGKVYAVGKRIKNDIPTIWTPKLFKGPGEGILGVLQGNFDLVCELSLGEGENFAGSGNEQTFTINDKNGSPINVVVGRRGGNRIQVDPTNGGAHVGRTNGNGDDGRIKGVAVIDKVLFIYGFAVQENRPTIWTPNLEKFPGQGIIGMTQFNLKKGVNTPDFCN